MAIPVIVGAGVAAAAAFGGKKAYDGYKTKEEAEEIVKNATSRYENAKEQLELQDKQTSGTLEKLGAFELKIGSDMNQFKIFAEDLLEKMASAKNSEVKINLPQHRLDKIADLSMSATEYLGMAVGGGAAGAAAGFAVYGGVMAFASASTGTAISTLSGAALYNATMAAIGGGAVSAGGLGMAAAPYVLGGAVSAPILAIAGYVYNMHAEKALENAREYRDKVNEAVPKMDLATEQLRKVDKVANNILSDLHRIYEIFNRYFEQLKSVNTLIKNHLLSDELMNDNLILIVQNGYQLAAIMTDIITTPLFKVRKSPAGQVIVEAKKDEKGKDVYIPVVETDENGMQVINYSEINAALAEGSDEEIQKVLAK